MNSLLNDIFGEAISPERRLAIFTTPGNRTRFFADLVAVEAHALKASGEGRNVYFGLGLISGSPKGRGKAKDVAAIGCLWADIDIRHAAHKNTDLPASIDEVEALLAELPLAPSVVVDSGHGRCIEKRPGTVRLEHIDQHKMVPAYQVHVTHEAFGNDGIVQAGEEHEQCSPPELHPDEGAEFVEVRSDDVRLKCIERVAARAVMGSAVLGAHEPHHLVPERQDAEQVSLPFGCQADDQRGSNEPFQNGRHALLRVRSV